jgi:hypothetical protein
LNLKDDDEEEKIEEKTSDNLESKVNESSENNDEIQTEIV